MRDARRSDVVAFRDKVASPSPGTRKEARLGELVRLEPRSDGDRGRPVPAGPARLLLFTGVRYERHTEPDDRPQPDDPQASAGGKRRNG
jgi:hypothetical protein